LWVVVIDVFPLKKEVEAPTNLSRRLFNGRFAIKKIRLLDGRRPGVA